VLVNPGPFVVGQTWRWERALAELPVTTGLVTAVNERLQIQRCGCVSFSQRYREGKQSFPERTIINLSLIRTMSFPDNDQRHRLRRRFAEFRIQLIGARSKATTGQIDFDNIDVTSNKLFMTNRDTD
jgi:hypothetical protein